MEIVPLPRRRFLGDARIRIYRNHERYNTKSKWKMTQDVMYWINSRKAEDKGLTFWQTRSRAFILYDSVPADCIEKLVSTKSDKIFVSKGSYSAAASQNCVERSLARYNTIKNYSSKQASRNRLQDRKIHSKSISERKECHIKQHLKIEDA